jgi:hypothetical protein
MLLVAVGILFWFRHKGYIGALRDDEAKLEKKLERKDRESRVKKVRP